MRERDSDACGRSGSEKTKQDMHITRMLTKNEVAVCRRS